MSDGMKPLVELLPRHADARLRDRVEAAEKLAREAEVELLETKRRTGWLEEQLGTTLSLLREARGQLAETIRERDDWRARAEARSKLLVVR